MSGGPGHRGPPLLAARATPSSSSASDSLHASNESSMDSLASATARDGASGTRSTGNTVMAVREARSGTRPKRTLIESACAACRRRKSRCDGVRPACSRCQTLRTECAYEAEEGESRWSALRRRNQMLENERAESRELIAFLQTRPEAEAQEIFNRIRIGGYDDIFSLLRQVRDGELSNSVSRSSTPTRAGLNMPLAEQRLPSIRSIIEVPGHSHLPPAAPMGVATHQPPPRPPLLTPENSRGSTSSGTSIEYPKSMPPL